jgi:hypothetical protein
MSKLFNLNATIVLFYFISLHRALHVSTTSGHPQVLQIFVYNYPTVTFTFTFVYMWLFNRRPLWSGGQSSWLQSQRTRVRFLALPDFLRSSGSGTGSTQPREDNWGATFPRWRYSIPPPHGYLQSESQSQSYFTTGGLPPITSSGRQAPGDPRPEFLFSK